MEVIIFSLQDVIGCSEEGADVPAPMSDKPTLCESVDIWRQDGREMRAGVGVRRAIAGIVEVGTDNPVWKACPTDEQYK